MKISSIPQIYRHLNRWREILSVLSKYELAAWISRLGPDFAKDLAQGGEGDSPGGMLRHLLSKGDPANILWAIGYRVSQMTGWAGDMDELLSSDKLAPERRTCLRRDIAVLCYTLTEPDINPRGAMTHLGNPNMPVLKQESEINATIEDKMPVTAVGPLAPGQDVLVALYPQAKDETAPRYEVVADGAARITTNEATDYVFPSARPMEFAKDDVTFHGLAGAVRVFPNEVHLVLSEGLQRQGRL